MFVSKSMTRKVITIEGQATALVARRIMMKQRIRHLPVVSADQRLIGIVTDRDLRMVLSRDLFQNPDGAAAADPAAAVRVAEIMTPDPLTIRPEHTIEDALLLIQEKRVGAFPVVDEDGLVRGILSVRDLLRAFINVLGIGEPGTLLDDRLTVACGEGALRLLELQRAGKSAMAAEDFLRGFTLPPGTELP